MHSSEIKKKLMKDKTFIGCFPFDKLPPLPARGLNVYALATGAGSPWYILVPRAGSPRYILVPRAGSPQYTSVIGLAALIA